MIENARRWRILAGGVAAGMAGVLGFAGNTATADPVYPLPPQPGPATVTQTVLRASRRCRAVAQSDRAGRRRARPPAAQSATAPGSHPSPQSRHRKPWCPPAPGPWSEFFKEKGVKLEPQVARDFKALNIVLPVPRGWSQVPDPNVPDAFAVLADRVGGDGIYTSNAALVVYKLVGGDFDPKDAITHGYIDAQQLAAWRTTKASLADFGGMPSATDRGHLPRQQHDAQHLAPAHHRDRGPGQIPGVAVGHHHRPGGGRRGRRHRRHHQRVQDQRPRRHPVRSAGAPAARAQLARRGRRTLKVGRMLFAAVGCLCAAAATAALGGWTLSRPRSADVVRQVLRAVAPTQLAAAAMLAVAGVVALSAQPETGAVGGDRVRYRRDRHGCGGLLAERQVRRGQGGGAVGVREGLGRLWQRRLRDLHPVQPSS